MKNYLSLLLLFVFATSLSLSSIAQTIKYAESTNQQGFTVKTDNLQHAVIRFSLAEFALNDVNDGGELMKSITIPGVFLPNNEGAPDLPMMGRYIAVPAGATASIKIHSTRTEILKNQNIAPAPRIPLDIEDGSLQYEKRTDIYSVNTAYPKEPASISEIIKFRGMDMVMLSVSPFQYNPVTKELTINRDMEIEIVFSGGNGKVGDERLRSRWWDAMLMNETMNKGIIPSVDYSKPKVNTTQLKSTEASNNFEYLIITADNPDFLAWADSIRQFRTQQGISAGVVTTTQVGGNTVAAIENYVNNAYNTWSVPPVAVLLLGDFTQVTSPTFAHPSGYPDFPSDNQYADVNGDDLPDIIFSRIPANDAAQLKVMVSKSINYERNPPVKASFYNNPITALGWQTERWFQLCSEIVGGYFKHVQGKTPVRINAVYSGDPTIDPWSTAGNTSTIMSYFGPAGQGYIPATPQETGGFTGGTGSSIITAVNNGSFLLLHRDHGYAQGWGEPAFNTSSVNSLRNINNELPFVFSINCQTGAYQGSSECLAEKFERYSYNGQNSGALGVIAPTEVSYSFLNDTYLWGVFDNLFPDFMPDKTTKYPTSFVMPAFANAAGKYFLYQSNWSGYGTTYQQATARLFHCYGDAFMTLYTEVPQALTVNHASTLPGAATSFEVTADTGSLIALTVNGTILGTANGTGTAVNFLIPPQYPGDVMIVTVTKQNHFRYSAKVSITAGGPVADFSASPSNIIIGGTANFNDLSSGNPTTWLWSFPGGTPSSSTLKSPVVTYPSIGVYNVTLTASNSTGSNTKTKTAYITVSSGAPAAGFSANKTAILPGEAITYSDLSTNTPTSWLWSFPGGTPSASTLQNPVVSYAIAGNYNVTLTASNSSGSNMLEKASYIVVSNAVPVADFVASKTALITDAITTYTDLSTNNPTSWAWTFPGGTPSSSTLQNPSVSYTSSGTYSVSLTATNASGSSSLTKSSYISVSVAPPVANFSSDATRILNGGNVNFSDLSTGNPTSWSWSFEGGTPSASALQNPTVTYSGSGVYYVSLTVSNASGSNTKTLAGYITVWNGIVTYCKSGSLSASTEWISQFKFGVFTKASGSSLYSDYTTQQIAAVPGSTVPISLTTGFAGKSRKEFWKIWIDYNNDGDFTDAGENVFTGTGPKGTLNGSVNIAASATMQARMRVSMKYGAYPLPCETFANGETEDYMLNFAMDAMPGFTDHLLTPLSIFPNPTIDYINVFTGSEQSEAFIYELKGTLLIHRLINYQEKIDLQHLPNGIYLMKVLINKSIYYGKIVKQ